MEDQGWLVRHYERKKLARVYQGVPILINFISPEFIMFFRGKRGERGERWRRSRRGKGGGGQ